MNFYRDLTAIARLAWPNFLSFGAQLLMVAIDGAVAARLGALELAAIALILPIQMLLVQSAHGAFGAATAGNIARAIGARDNNSVRNVAAHALAVAGIVGTLIACVGWLYGPEILAAAGGQGRVLELAASYLVVLFGAGILVWLNGALVGIARGAKMMWLPTWNLLATALVHLAVAPALALGLAGLPAMGLRGLAWSYLISYAVTLAPLGWVVVKQGLLARLLPAAWDKALLRLMRQTAGLAVIASVLNNLSVMISNRLVSTFGAETLAGYGLAARLEYVIAPLVFSVGTALITLCGQARGAGELAQARRYAITGVSVAAVVVGLFGGLVAIYPNAWLRWFVAPANVTQEAHNYLRVAGFAYAFFGAGLTAFFASQAFGDMRRPMFGAVFRIIVIVAGGAVAASYFDNQPLALFAVMALAFVAYGVNNVLAVLHLSRLESPAERAARDSNAGLANASTR